MKKSILLLTVIFALAAGAQAQIYKGTKTSISFFSYTPMENISATDTIATMLLNAATGDVMAKTSVKGFIFPNALMQEHFNENYMESDKYPDATFKGKINEKIDYTKDGVYPVTMPGTLTIHGVAKQVTLPGTMTIKGGVATIDSKFDVLLTDYNIKVPTAVGQKIATTISVTVHSDMNPIKK